MKSNEQYSRALTDLLEESNLKFNRKIFVELKKKSSEHGNFFHHISLEFF